MNTPETDDFERYLQASGETWGASTKRLAFTRKLEIERDQMKAKLQTIKETIAKHRQTSQ